MMNSFSKILIALFLFAICSVQADTKFRIQQHHASKGSQNGNITCYKADGTKKDKKNFGNGGRWTTRTWSADCAYFKIQFNGARIVDWVLETSVEKTFNLFYTDGDASVITVQMGDYSKACARIDNAGTSGVSGNKVKIQYGNDC